MKKFGFIQMKMIVLLVISNAFFNSVFSQYAFNIPAKENNRLLSYGEIWVEVSGKLALCSHSEKGSIILNVGGGKPPYTFKWNTNETTQNRSNLNAGTYTVWIKDSEGKVHQEKIIIQPPFPLLLNPVEKKDATCGSGNDGYAKISVKIGRNDYEKDSPPYKVTWSNGLKNVWEANNLAPGTYTVLVEDKYNCSVSVSFDIKSGSQGITATETVEQPTCQAGSSGKISLSVSGGQAPYTYKWSNGATSKDLNGLSPGVYQIQIQDSKGCTFQKSFTITSPSSIEIQPNLLHPSCQGSADGSIEVLPSGGKAPYTYLWNNGQTSQKINNLTAGSYNVKITDASGCSVERQFNLQNQSALELKLVETRQVSCSGSADGGISFELKGAKGAYTVKWSDGTSNQLQRKDLKAGAYTIEVTDESGCKVSSTVQLQEATSLQARIETALDVDCTTGKVTGVAWVSIQGGKEPYTISWNPGEKNAREINFDKSGILKVAVKDALGCTVESEAKVDFPVVSNQGARLDFQYRKLSISNDPEVLVEEEVLFESEISPEFIAWEWQFGDGKKSVEKDPIHIFEKPGTYEVTLTGFDIFGCSSIEKNTIQVASQTELVVIPNAFSPNGDGLNDTFIPLLKGISSFNLEVFNTWGEKIFITNSIESKGWDGTFRGQLSPPGNYLYRITYITPDGKAQSKSGGITLIR